MKVCPNCQSGNREGIYFCEECGQNLTTVTSIATKAFRNSTAALADAVISPSVATWGTGSFRADSSLIFHVRDFPEPLSVKPNSSTQLVIGRIDPNTGARPDVDLAPYGAQEKGVSRSHATLRRVEMSMTLTDLGSVNGTYLNGQRLIAQQPRMLRDGDELRVGKLVMHVYFK